MEDKKSPFITSGIRIGTNSLAVREFEFEEMVQCADLIVRILSAIKANGDRKYELDQAKKEAFQDEVEHFFRYFSLPGYPANIRRK